MIREAKNAALDNNDSDISEKPNARFAHARHPGSIGSFKVVEDILLS